MQIKDLLGKKTPSPEQVAEKHKVPVQQILDQLKIGIKVESEHINDAKIQREIALDHLNELPDYYTRLAKMEKE